MQGPSRRRILKGAGTPALGAAFATRAGAAAPPPQPITPQLIEAANKEGKVVLYSAMDLLVGEKLGKAFRTAYPAITIQIERSGSERLFQPIAQEFDSNIHAADVVNSCDASHFILWKKNGWLTPFVPDEVAKFFPEQYRDGDGMFATSRLYLSSIAYNTSLVKLQDAPKSYADLLDAKWAGKIVKAHPAHSGTIMTATFQRVREPTGIFAGAPHPNAAKLFQAWLHTRKTQQFFVDFTAQYSVHARVTSKIGRRKISDIKLMNEDPAGVEVMSEEIKTRYAKLFRV